MPPVTGVPLSLPGTFDEDAELYDRARPGYPAALFDDLAALAGVGPDCRVLEIGPGTGKATIELAQRGCQIIAVELGSSLAAVAARNLAAVPGAQHQSGGASGAAQIVVSAFEAWPLPADPFDVVVAATAYHRLDPTVRVAKIAQALRPDGMLAVVETHHVAGPDGGFFDDVQDCYQRWNPTTTPGYRLPHAGDIPQTADTDHSGPFAPAVFLRYVWDQTYNCAAYLDLLLTYSDHRAMPDTARAGLFDCIASLVNDRHGGRVTKHYLTQRWLARRRP
jgi:SAM-dependent methyltransferase